MFGAVRSPTRKQAVSGHIEQAAAVDSHEAWIPTSRVLDHPRHNSFSSAQLFHQLRLHQLAHHLRIGLVAQGAHDLADEEP